MTISSHTIVRNGMPFIGKVLEQVAPYMDEMIITLSTKSTDRTFDELKRFYEKYPIEVVIDTENVSAPGELTEIRNRQVFQTKSDWILFLDDDDYWPKDQLELCLNELDKDSEIQAYSVNPYQLLDWEHHDWSWRAKSFSKFLRNAPGLHYIHPWPRDLPADKDGMPLYHKTHPKVKRLPYKFYHLSYLKGHSFRTEEWAGQFSLKKGSAVKLPEKVII